MKNFPLYRQLQRVQHALKQETLEAQDAEITELYHQLEEFPERLLPAFLYPLLVDVLTYYGREILPALNLSVEDNRYISEGLGQRIQRLQVQEQSARDLEIRFARLFHQVKAGELTSVTDLVTALGTIIASCVPSFPEKVPGGIFSTKKKRFEKQYQAVLKSSFTAVHVLPFFEALLFDIFQYSPPGSAGVPPVNEAGGTPALPGLRKDQEWGHVFTCIQDLFWHQLHELLQIKAVLVNILTRKVLITRLDVTTCLEQAGFDDLQFDNNVDEKMYQSCWNALLATRAFLEKHFPDTILGAQASCLHVHCRFPNPSAEYNDSSASLLVGLKIVGDVLDLEVDPHTVVTGEVDSTGQILPVDHVTEKVTAAEHHPNIQHIYLPHYGFVVRTPRITITPVRTFAEAVEDYYGEQFRKKQRQLIRRQILKGAAALATIPTGLFSFKNIFTHSVTEEDVWLVEYAKELRHNRCDHQKALTILTAILQKFDRETSSTEALYIKARALRLSGGIYILQNTVDKGLTCYYQAYHLWETIHDREHQVDTLLDIAVNYENLQFNRNIAPKKANALRYFQEANELLHPGMKNFTILQGRYYRRLGYFYDNMGDYEIAEHYTREGLAVFDRDETRSDYQITKRHLGTICIRTGKYDEAHEILQAILAAPILQTPIHRAKVCQLLADLFFSIEDYDQGMQWVHNSAELCREFGLQIQQRVLRNMLARHQVAFLGEV